MPSKKEKPEKHVKSEVAKNKSNKSGNDENTRRVISFLESRQILNEFFLEQVKQLPETFKDLSPKERVDSLLKLTPYFLPKADALDGAIRLDSYLFHDSNRLSGAFFNDVGVESARESLKITLDEDDEDEDY